MFNTQFSFFFQELQDRIDELQSELQEFHSLGRVHQTCNKPLSEELESKSPGMESDPGSFNLHHLYLEYLPRELITETEGHKPCNMTFFRHRFRGGSAIQHEPGGGDDDGATEGATPSGNGGIAKSAGQQSKSRR